MRIRLFIAMMCMFALTTNFANADEQTPEQAKAVENTEEEVYNPGETILEHVTDAHEWHILTVGETHISVPLPIILYSDGHLDIFMSSKFHHGKEVYKGYKLGYTDASGKKIKEGICCVDEHGEPIVEAGVIKTPLDFSMTKTAAALIISCIILLVLVLCAKRSCVKNQGKAPKGLQSLIELGVIFVRDGITKPLIGEKKQDKYLPYMITLFLFIFLSNVLGLIPFFPGGANITGNIAVTGILAIITFLLTTFSSNKHYWKDIFNTPGVPWWLKIPLPIMPIVEFVGMLIKPFVLMVRLFANITAGHIVTLGFVSLIFIFGNMGGVQSMGMGLGVSPISLVLTLFISALECLVAFIQAYVFTMLSSLYIGMAVAEPEHEEVKLEVQKA